MDKKVWFLTAAISVADLDNLQFFFGSLRDTEVMR